MNKKEYIKPAMDVVNVAPLSMIAESLPSSVPGGFPGIGGGGGIAHSDTLHGVEEDMTDYDSQIKGLLW